jgi:two-component system LytT family response regulator
MNILSVDNERPALNILNRAILEAVPGVELHSFTRSSEAVAEVRDKGFRPDVAFLDIEMPGMTGLDLASVIKITYPAVNIVFVTGFSQYALDALAQRPSGYVMKPATKEKIFEELKNLRNPPARADAAKPIFVRCFGSFDVFVNGRPVQFIRAKSKELLAYLVDRRGAGCSAAEAASILWEDGVYDRSRQKQFSVIRSDLIKSLVQSDAQSILAKEHDALSVRPDTFDCDYYMALAGDSVAVNKFLGEYMSPYTWAEFTTGALAARYGIS